MISHVADGLELARGARLPAPIIDAIAQHHGMHLLTYFHNRAVDANGGRAVDEGPCTATRGPRLAAGWWAY